MKKIDHSTAADGLFTEGNPATGTPATVVTADWLNGVQEELAHVIEQAGITLDGEDLTQLRQAIETLIAAGLPDLSALLAHLTDTSDPHATIAALLASANAWDKVQTYGAPAALAINAGTVTWDAGAAPKAKLTLTENVTAITLQNAANEHYELTIVQDATGGRTVAWPAGWLWPGGSAAEVTADAWGVDVYTLSGDAGTIRVVGAQDFKAVS